MKTITSSNVGGASVSYTCDGLNRLSSVVDNNLPGQSTTNYIYDNTSNVATVVYPNGLTSAFTYDPLNRLNELSTTTTPVDDYRYTLGLAGNRTNATEQSGRVLAWNYNGIYPYVHLPLTRQPDTGNQAYTEVDHAAAESWQVSVWVEHHRPPARC